MESKSAKKEDGGLRSRRPMPPPAFFGAMGLWVSAAVTYSASHILEQTHCLAAIGFAAGVALFGVVLLLKTKYQVLCCLLIGTALGVSASCAASVEMMEQEKEVEGDVWQQRVFEVLEDAKEGEFGKSCIARTQLRDGRHVKIRLFFQDTDKDLRYGQMLEATTALRLPSTHSEEYYWQKGLAGSATIYSCKILERNDAMQAVLGFREAALSRFDGFEGDGASLLRAILFGDRSGLGETGLYTSIKSTGLAHMVAVSGAHLVFVTSFLALGLRALRLPRTGIAIVQLFFISAYLVFTGMPISALRAACMASFSVSSFFIKRRAASLNALSLCICIMVVAGPQTSLSVSFALSAGSTLGIILLRPLFSLWCSLLPFGKRAAIRDGLSMTLASYAFTLPVSASVFSQVSLIAPFANIVAIPCFTLLCGSGFFLVCATLVFPFLENMLLSPLVFAAQTFCEAVELMGTIPYAAIPCAIDLVPTLVVSVIASALLWRFWPQPTTQKARTLFGASAILLAIGLAGSSFSLSDEIIMLDVGQGDAFVIRSKGSTVLIDTGNKDASLLAGLARHGIYKLDAVLITHADDDHCASLNALKGVVQVGAVCLAAPALTCTCNACSGLVGQAQDIVGTERLLYLSVGDAVTVGKFTLEVVWPIKFTDKGSNGDSLCLIAKYPAHDGKRWQAFFCGDAEATQLKELADSGFLDDIDILKVGHHGSKAALDEYALETMKPKISLVSVGSGNRYGHPSAEAIDLLRSFGSEVLRSDEAGDVVCKINSEKVTVSTLR